MGLLQFRFRTSEIFSLGLKIAYNRPGSSITTSNATESILLIHMTYYESDAAQSYLGWMMLIIKNDMKKVESCCNTPLLRFCKNAQDCFAHHILR